MMMMILEPHHSKVFLWVTILTMRTVRKWLWIKRGKVKRVVNYQRFSKKNAKVS